MDRIFYNGKIRTLEKDGEIVQAVGVRNGLISVLGDDHEVLLMKTEKTQLIDLGGRPMLPGFNDSHMHMLCYGIYEDMVDLGGAKSWREAADRIRKYILEKNIKKGNWVYGKNWNQENWEERIFPTRMTLDEISLDHPIVLTRVCTHVEVVNTEALARTGLFGAPTEIDGGKMDVGEDGIVNGILRENAVGLLYRDMEPLGVEKLKEIIVKASKEMLQKGITSVQTDDLTSVSGTTYDAVLRAFEELSEEKKLPVRVTEQVRFMSKKSLAEFLQTGKKTGSGNTSFRIGPLKLFVDGSLGARTALMRKPYADDVTTAGIGIFKQDELDELVCFAHENGMQVAIHCIGDQAIEMAIFSFEKVIGKEGNVLRHGIVHCQITDKALLERMGTLGLLAYIQPVFVQSDYKIVEDRVGKEMSEYSYGWKTMLKSGMMICGGSDCPVERFDILPNIYCAVTRKDYEGLPEEGWNPKEGLSMDEAVQCFTIGGARASFEENQKGTLAVGKLADMVVLEKDIYDMEESGIKDVEVQLTIINGEILWKANSFSNRK